MPKQESQVRDNRLCEMEIEFMRIYRYLIVGLIRSSRGVRASSAKTVGHSA